MISLNEYELEYQMLLFLCHISGLQSCKPLKATGCMVLPWMLRATLRAAG